MTIAPRLMRRRSQAAPAPITHAAVPVPRHRRVQFARTGSHVQQHNSLDNSCLGTYNARMTPPRATPAPHVAERAPATPQRAASVRPKYGIIRQINRVRVELIDALERELSRFDITAPQLIVLASLANKEAVSAAGLCKSISYDPGAMTRMIDRLEQKALIRRVPHPEDRRAMNLELTTAGRALYPQLLAAKESVQAQFLRGFAQHDIDTLDALLDRLLANR